MATNDFLIFDEQNQNVMTNAEYQSATQRVSGVVPGIAEPELHNKLYRQLSVMAAAIGRVLVSEGLDAKDDDVAALAENIKKLFVFKSLAAHPVGSFYFTAGAESPAELFGGTWTQIKGRFLFASNSSYAAGSTGGEATHKLTENEMPPHIHNGTAVSAGAHTHSGTAASAGAHTHSGTAVTAGAHYHGSWGERSNYSSPFGLYDSANTHIGSNDTDYDNALFKTSTDGAHSHNVNIGSAGAHTHNITAASAGAHTHKVAADSAGAHAHNLNVSATGGGGEHNNMPPYLVVNVWQRTA